MAIGPWADVEASLSTINIEEIIAEEIWAYLDLPAGGIKESETLDHGWIAAYYGDYSTKAKTDKMMGGQQDLFKEFSVLFMTVAMLHTNPYATPKGKGSLLITEFKGHHIDWTE